MTKISKIDAATNAADDGIYANLQIADDARRELLGVAADLHKLDQRSTEHVFRKGELLESAAKLLPDTTIERWAREACGYTGRSVRTFRAIHRNLTGYKRELVDLAVGATVLGKLSSAGPELIEDAIAFAREHGRLHVSDVTIILGGDTAAADSEGNEQSIFDVGGIDGLKALIATKARDGLKSFTGHCEKIKVDVTAALASTRIIKKDLGLQTEVTARLAWRELENLIQFVSPSEFDAHFIHASSLPDKTRWKRASDTLHRMGGVNDWPDAKDLREWLELEVLPILVWVTSTTRNPDWQLADPKAVASISPTVISAPEPTALIVAKTTKEPASDQLRAVGQANAQNHEVVRASTEEDENAETQRYAEVEKRFAPFAEAMGATITFEKPKAQPKARARTPNALPSTLSSLSNDDIDSSDLDFIPPAFLHKTRALADLDMPTVEEATRGASVRVR